MSETPARYRATLVRGQIYILGNQTFTFGTPKEVDQATKDILDRDAFDLITVEFENRMSPKFKIEAIPEKVVDEAVRVRQR